MLEFLKRDRSPRVLFATMFLAWLVTIATSQATTADPPPVLRFVMAVVMVLALTVAAFCFVRLLFVSFRR